MKTAAEYIETVYGTRTFARAVDVNDAVSLMDLMQDFSNANCKELLEGIRILVERMEENGLGNFPSVVKYRQLYKTLNNEQP